MRREPEDVLSIRFWEKVGEGVTFPSKMDEQKIRKAFWRKKDKVTRKIGDKNVYRDEMRKLHK